jgi:hypothetical protein
MERDELRRGNAASSSPASERAKPIYEASFPSAVEGRAGLVDTCDSSASSRSRSTSPEGLPRPVYPSRRAKYPSWTLDATWLRLDSRLRPIRGEVMLGWYELPGRTYGEPASSSESATKTFAGGGGGECNRSKSCDEEARPE